MAHDTTHGDAQQSTENKPKMALNAAFWFVLILSLLFIAAVNFVDIMSHSEEHEGAEGAKTEKTEVAAPATHEAQPATPATDTMHH